MQTSYIGGSSRIWCWGR